MPKPGVSVIVCCYNSSRKLPPTLAHLAKQKTPPDLSWELIVVDNASKDDTAQVALSEWKKYPTTVPITVISEATPGLSSARKQGISKSTYETLIFCDDDNWLDENYVASSFMIMNSSDELGATGGKGIPHFETAEPMWFKEVSSFYGVGDQSNSIESQVNNFRYLYGAGMVLSKTAINRLFDSGFVNFTSDRSGSTLMSGGDIEIAIGLQMIGYRLVYSPQLTFMHFMPANRLTLRYLIRLLTGIGYSSELLYPFKRKYNNDLTVPYPSVGSLIDSLKRSFTTGLVLLLPFHKYGSFMHKLKVFVFELGRLKFQMSRQGFFKV